MMLEKLLQPVDDVKVTIDTLIQMYSDERDKKIIGAKLVYLKSMASIISKRIQEIMTPAVLEKLLKPSNNIKTAIDEVIKMHDEKSDKKIINAKLTYLKNIVTILSGRIQQELEAARHQAADVTATWNSREEVGVIPAIAEPVSIAVPLDAPSSPLLLPSAARATEHDAFTPDAVIPEESSTDDLFDWQLSQNRDVDWMGGDAWRPTWDLPPSPPPPQLFSLDSAATHITTTPTEDRISILSTTDISGADDYFPISIEAGEVYNQYTLKNRPPLLDHNPLLSAEPEIYSTESEMIQQVRADDGVHDEFNDDAVAFEDDTFNYYAQENYLYNKRGRGLKQVKTGAERFSWTTEKKLTFIQLIKQLIDNKQQVTPGMLLSLWQRQHPNDKDIPNDRSVDSYLNKMRADPFNHGLEVAEVPYAWAIQASEKGISGFLARLEKRQGIRKNFWPEEWVRAALEHYYSSVAPGLSVTPSIPSFADPLAPVSASASFHDLLPSSLPVITTSTATAISTSITPIWTTTTTLGKRSAPDNPSPKTANDSKWWRNAMKIG